MNPTIHRLKLIFLAIFAVGCVGVAVYQFGWVIPARKCEAQGNWFDWQGRVCARPVLISDITGRTIPERHAEAAKAAAAAPPAGGSPGASPVASTAP